MRRDYFCILTAEKNRVGGERAMVVTTVRSVDIETVEGVFWIVANALAEKMGCRAVDLVVVHWSISPAFVGDIMPSGSGSG